LQTLIRVPWIPALGAEFHLALDPYSLLLIALTLFLTVCSSVISRKKTAAFHFCLWSTALAAIGVFLAADLLLFFVFWELTLIPMYFVIALWGGERRQYAALKFLIYTNLGGVLMLLGILLVRFQFGTFNYLELGGRSAGPLVFWAFFAGCAVKVPMLPFHTWLPDAHTEAPTAGSVLLAGVMLKLGTYGLVRFAIPLAPDTARVAAPWLGALSIAAILYGALVSLMQKDWKKLIAYSSVSHLGFCTVGMFAFTTTGLTGSMLQQVNHGITTSLLFILVGAAYERTNTREIAAYGGVWSHAPQFALVFLVAVLGSMGMPPLNGFIGELTIIQGVLPVSMTWAIGCGVGIALGAAYLLWLYQRVCFGSGPAFADLTWRERIVCYPLAALTIAIGVWPAPWLNLLEGSAARILSGI
jgi:NADH-quinone oxidoreductase subunit M